MQNYQINIRVVDDINYEVVFKNSLDIEYTFKCTQKSLQKKYGIEIEELDIITCLRIVKAKDYSLVKKINYSSSVTVFNNNLNNLQFQIEDGLVLVTRLDNQEEFFLPLNVKNIEELKKLNLKDFKRIKATKKKLTPMSTRIQTQDSNFGF